MLIAQISDTHILAPSSDHPSVGKRAEWLQQCVEAINEDRPDAVLFTGDTVQLGQREEYEYLLSLLQPLTAPLYVVPGNRDDNQVLRSVLGAVVDLPDLNGVLNYVVDEHAVRLVALDSTAVGERKGVFSIERLAWLENVLNEQPDRPTILFIHHPPFSVGDHYIGGYRHAEDAAAFTDVVSRHSQVLALLCGHVHHPVQRAWAGTRAIIMPSIAVDLRKGVDEEIARERPIYMLHQFSKDTGLTSVARTVSQ